MPFSTSHGGDYRIVRTTAESSTTKDSRQCWKVRIEGLRPDWDGSVVLSPSYHLGAIAVVPQADFDRSPGAGWILDVQRDLASEEDAHRRTELQRLLAAARCESRVASHKIIIPREIVGAISPDESDRDIIVADLVTQLEVWSTRRWWEHLRQLETKYRSHE